MVFAVVTCMGADTFNPQIKVLNTFKTEKEAKKYHGGVYGWDIIEVPIPEGGV